MGLQQMEDDAPAPEVNVFVVTRNADMTEGRGPMLFDSVWGNFEAADAYVLQEPGVMGQKQERHTKGPSIDPDTGLRRWSYGSFYIQEATLRTAFDPRAKAAALQAVKEAEAALAEAKKHAAKFKGRGY